MVLAEWEGVGYPVVHGPSRLKCTADEAPRVVQWQGPLLRDELSRRPVNISKIIEARIITGHSRVLLRTPRQTMLLERKQVRDGDHRCNRYES